MATLTPATKDIELRLQEMDRVGMDAALPSLTGPNVCFASLEGRHRSPNMRTRVYWRYAGELQVA